MNKRNTKVYILGAGCSRDCGFPLGPEVPKRMKEWVQTLDPELAPRLIRATEKTLELMGGTIDTIDTLVYKIDGGDFDESDATFGAAAVKNQNLRFERIYEAKVATSAFFQSLEPAAIGSGLGRYRQFLFDLFPGADSNWFSQRFSERRTVVMSFNYDRMFELAFQDRFNIDLNQYGIYGEQVLNSGLSATCKNQIRFANDCFSFLKLHGSAGMWVSESFVDGFDHECRLPTCDPSWMPTDHRFFPNGEEPDPREFKRYRRPLIVFPHERQGILRRQRLGVEQDYVRKVWEQAEKVIEEASEITFIGYSFQGIDQAPILDLLSRRKCQHVRIHGPDADIIAENLTLRRDGWNDVFMPTKCKFSS